MRCTLYVCTYLTRCGHCKRLAPEYEKAAAMLAGDDPPVPLAKVDATVESSLANRFGIDGYPTLKVFHHGTAYDYEGPRTAQGWPWHLLATPFITWPYLVHDCRYC